MPAPFSPEFKAHAIERMIANNGDVIRTSRELGISDRTLYKWRKNAGIRVSPPPTPPTTTADSPPLHGMERGLGGEVSDANPIPPDDLQALRDLKSQMLDLTRYIMKNDQIKPAIDAAPLKERIAAATQLIDRIIKLGTQLPAEQQEEDEYIVYEREETDEEEIAGAASQETARYSE